MSLPLLFPELVASAILVFFILGESMKREKEEKRESHLRRGTARRALTAAGAPPSGLGREAAGPARGFMPRAGGGDAEQRRPLTQKNFAAPIVALGSVVLLLSILPFWGGTRTGYSNTLLADSLSVFFKGFFAVTVLIVSIMSREFFLNRVERRGEFFLILWISIIGLFFLVSANDLLLLFISLEIFTLSLYVLAAYLKRELISIEAGLKYFILGSLASAFVIYGVSLVYVAAGSTLLPEIKTFFQANPSNRLVLLGLLCMLSGFGFKVASVPFQWWVPDVYEGAPAPVAAYLAVGSKTAGFAILLRLLFGAFAAFDPRRELLFAALAVMTLVYGNLGALGQTNIKRLFGYSSISHAGYLLTGLAAGGIAGTAALLYYLVAYAFSNLAAFMAITLVGRELGSDQISAYRGLARRSPFLAACFFIALLSLAGVPPLAGFFGKFLILLAAVQAGLGWLALWGALGAAVSLYYYLTVVRMMYIEDSSVEKKIALSRPVKWSLFLLTAGTLAAGFWQAPFYAIAHRAAASLF